MGRGACGKLTGKGGRAAGTAVALLARPLGSGSLVAEIPQLNSTGVSVTNASFGGVDVQLSVTQQGGAAEAEALLNGDLAADQATGRPWPPPSPAHHSYPPPLLTSHDCHP